MLWIYGGNHLEVEPSLYCSETSHNDVTCLDKLHSTWLQSSHLANEIERQIPSEWRCYSLNETRTTDSVSHRSKTPA